MATLSYAPEQLYLPKGFGMEENTCLYRNLSLNPSQQTTMRSLAMSFSIVLTIQNIYFTSYVLVFVVSLLYFYKFTCL